MNQGFSLIETIVYVGLLSLLSFALFSSLSPLLFQKPLFFEEDYQLLIKNYHE